MRAVGYKRNESVEGAAGVEGQGTDDMRGDSSQTVPQLHAALTGFWLLSVLGSQQFHCVRLEFCAIMCAKDQ